jgi:hypothetical protein
MIHVVFTLLLLFVAFSSENETTRQVLTYGYLLYCLWYLYEYGLSIDIGNEEDEWQLLLYTIVS